MVNSPLYTPGSIETLILSTPGLSYLRRAIRLNEAEQIITGWEAVGSKGKGFQITFGSSIQEAIEALASIPYHKPDERREQEIICEENEAGFFVTALTTKKSEEVLFSEAEEFISYIKHNWEIKRTFQDGDWTIRAGVSLREHTFHGNTLREVMGKALLFGKFKIKIISADIDAIFAENYLPGLGEKIDTVKGIATRIRKVDLEALIKGEKLFQ